MTKGEMMRSIRMAALSGAILLALAALPKSACGQTPGASETSDDAAVAQDLTTAPAAGKWMVQGSFGFQFQGGRSEQLGLNLDVIVAHATRHMALIRLDLEATRSEYEQQPGGGRIVSDNGRTLMLTLLPRLKSPVAPIFIASTRQDIPLGLSHRTMLQAGPYLPLVSAKTVAVAVAALIGSGLQDNANVTSSVHVPTYGAMQSLTWRPTPTTTIGIYAAEHRNARDADDYGVYISTSLNANITRTLSMNVYHKYGYEGIHPDGVDAVQQNIGAGFQINIQ